MDKRLWSPALRPPSDIKTATRYARLGLIRNPFPATGVAPDNADLGLKPVGGVDAALENILQKFLDRRANLLVALVGDYGMGKTHTLRLLQELMVGEDFPLRPKVVYVSSAGYELYSLLRSILDSFGRDELTKTVWSMLLDDLRQKQKAGGYKWLVEQFGSDKEREKWDHTLWHSTELPNSFVLQEEHLRDYRHFLREFERRRFSVARLRNYAIGYLTRELKCSAFVAGELFDATDSDMLSAQAAWDRLTVPGEKKAPYKPQQETSFFQTMLTLVQRTGNYDSMALLVDEFEATVSSSLRRSEQEAYLRALRLLHDAAIAPSPLPLLMVLAMNADALKTIRSIYEGLLQRVVVIDLPVIDVMTATEIIANYLAPARPANWAPADSLSPLNTSVIESLVESLPAKSKSPRALVIRCHEIIERLADDSSIEVPISDLAWFLDPSQ
ncbi:MAG: hypothetical protein IT329_15955 [Caldilineaceae bacterium]|nr:hypothetical protein [Caldilineaceae bacterium]